MKALCLLVFSSLACAQTAFHGYSVTLTDYRDCDPRSAPCEATATHQVRVLPSGESYRETRLAGGGMGSHIVLILTKTARIQSYPETGQYYSLPNKLVAIPSVGDEKCAQAASALGPEKEAPKLQGEERIGKFQAFRYRSERPDGTAYTVWLFPAAGCAILQSVNEFRTGKTYQMFADLTPSFLDTAVLRPKGTESSPKEMLHAGFLAAAQSAKPPIAPAEAEKKWQDAMNNPSSPLYQSVTRTQQSWQRARELH